MDICRNEPGKSQRNWIQYCLKGGDYHCYIKDKDTGEIVECEWESSTDEAAEEGPRKKSRLAEAAGMIKSGKTMLEILDNGYESTIAQHARGLNFLMELVRSRTPMRTQGILAKEAVEATETEPAKPALYYPEVIWIFGPTKSGKSMKIWSENSDYDNIWNASISGDFFNGYRGQGIVVFDDFRGDSIKFHNLLNLLDCYPRNVNVKNGIMPWVPHKIYFTSCLAPWDVYGSVNENRNQFYRRLTHVFMTKKDPGATVYQHNEITSLLDPVTFEWNDKPNPFVEDENDGSLSQFGFAVDNLILY